MKGSVDRDLDELRQDWPGWLFGTVACTNPVWPEAIRYYATRGARLLTAWTPTELARDIRREEAAL